MANLPNVSTFFVLFLSAHFAIILALFVHLCKMHNVLCRLTEISKRQCEPWIWKQKILSCWVKLSKTVSYFCVSSPKEVCLICACWSADNGQALKSQQHVHWAWELVLGSDIPSTTHNHFKMNWAWEDIPLGRWNIKNTKKQNNTPTFILKANQETWQLKELKDLQVPPHTHTHTL